ncbi:hypothetical protein [Peribacillus sp. SI8-4]|uniref:hypothetical protein n=1 Tax=Peribacillus sp. SI8-4 TaxID=3048009 RepID=UPI002552E1C9|nr:hypothetical protein [Peribacillus sp. SI8-4]
MAETVSLPYLEALKGKFVRVYKGGPESREGRLIEVRSDYIVLQTEENQIVYYPIEHLKIVVENARKVLDLCPINDKEIVYPGTFLGALEALQDSCIQVNGGGPASKIGRVIDVKDEFLVLSTEKEGLVLFSISHIKSVTVVEFACRELPPQDIYDGIDTLNGILSRLIHNWVSVSAGGPERVEGILIEVAETYIVVVHNEELFYVTTEHIQFLVLSVWIEDNCCESSSSSSCESSSSSSSCESSSSSSSCESSSSSSSCESSSSSSSCESSSSSSSCESSAIVESSSSSSSEESSGRGQGRPRTNTFKQLWLENLIKAASQNTK